MAAAPQHTFQVLTKRPERMRDLLTDDDWVLAAIEEASSWVKKPGQPLDERDNYLWPGEDYHEFPVLRNVWLGVSIENRRFVDRADLLRETPAAVRFISAEPLPGPLLPDADYMEDREETYPLGDAPWHAWRPWADGYEGAGLDLEEIDWLIVGGESGAGHRGVDPDWVRALRNYATEECWQGPREGETAFFFKQWGGHRPKAGGRELDGQTWDEFPEAVA